MFEIINTKIDGLIHIIPKVFVDNRGYFLENHNQKKLQELGFNKNFVQENESKSKKGVLRGLHFQTQSVQGKLVRCITGKVLDVAVDLRKDSKTFLQWESVILDCDKKNMFYVPEGFAHGFLVLSDEAIFSYKCTNYYAPEYESGIIWNDPIIKIDWQLDKWGIDKLLISSKDKLLQNYSEKIYF